MIVVYMRVSSDEQRENQSIELQRIEMKAFCTDRGYANVETIEDDGYKGETLLEHRPGGKKLLSLLATRKVERVLAWRGDRIGRGVHVLVNAIEAIERAGAILESKREGVLSLKDSTKILMTCVQMGQASAEVAVLRDRVKTRQLQLAKEGCWMSPYVPFGFSKTGTKKDSRLGINPEEARTMHRIYKLACDRKSAPKIAEEMNRLGQLRRGKAWTGETIRQVIINLLNCGQHIYNKRARVKVDGHLRLRLRPKEEWLTRPGPAIVTAAVWEKANAEIHKHQFVAMAHAKRNYLLRGLIKCECCGLSYMGTAVTGKDRVYYRCHGSKSDRGPYSKRGERCPNKSLVGADIETLVWLDLLRYISNPGAAVRELRAVMAARDQEQPIEEDIAGFEKRLASRQSARDRVVELYVEGKIDKAEQNERLMRLNTEQTGLEKGLAELRKRAQDSQANVRQLQSVESMLLSIQKLLKGNPSFETRRRVVETFVTEIRVSPTTGVTVKYVFPPPAERNAQSSLPLSVSG